MSLSNARWDTGRLLVRRSHTYMDETTTGSADPTQPPEKASVSGFIPIKKYHYSPLREAVAFIVAAVICLMFYFTVATAPPDARLFAGVIGGGMIGWNVWGALKNKRP